METAGKWCETSPRECDPKRCCKKGYTTKNK